MVRHQLGGFGVCTPGPFLTMINTSLKAAFVLPFDTVNLEMTIPHNQTLLAIIAKYGRPVSQSLLWQALLRC